VLIRNAPGLLVEREEAIGTLRERLRLACDGFGQTVLVSGEAGIGKTGVLRALAQARGAAPLWWGACDALQTPHPLAPLYDVARSSDVSFTAQLRSRGSRAALFESVIRDLQQSRPATLFVIEDAHWADDATLDLIKFLGRRLERVPCLLAVSYRDDELAATHPLRRVIGELLSPNVARVQVSRLSREAVAVLARRALRSPSGVYEATGGNPFFVTEMLRASGDGMPRTVADLVLARFARLTAPAQELVRFASVVPREIERWLLESEFPQTIESLDECLDCGLLEADASVLRFRHELTRVVIETSLSEPASPALHRRVLDALVQRGGESIPAARLAHHAGRAGDSDAVLRYAPAAAVEAAQRGAHREAAAQYGAALACPASALVAERAAWLDAYARECQFTAQVSEGIEARKAAGELHRRAGDTVSEALNLSELALAYVRALKVAEADEASLNAIALLEARAPGIELAHAYRVQAHLRMLDGECTEAIAWSEKAIAMAERCGGREVLVAALGVLGAATLYVDYETGCNHLREAFDIARTSGDDFTAAIILNNLGSGSAEVFRLPEAREHLLETVAFARRRDVDSARSYATAWLAMTEMYLGRWSEATNHALEVIEGTDRTISRVTALVALARVRTRSGAPGAEALLDEASSLVESAWTLQRIGPIGAARAEAAWLRGDSPAAVAEARPALLLRARHVHAWFSGELTYIMRRAGASDVPAAPLAEPFRLQLDGRARDAATAWASLQCPYERARALAEGGPGDQLEALEIFERLGARQAADAVRRQLRVAAVRVPRGARASTRRNPCDLTERELEILVLLCEGLRNAEIAERLCRSVRTVDHHVAAAFTKLGVSTRTEAVSAALRMGIAAAGRAGRRTPNEYAEAPAAE
jgi:DNA-binding CsgD family transcriptional regulator/tetratricopeptide (TPR) repeat protein